MKRRSSGLNVPLYEVIAWSFFDWANSAFPTVITTFIFATYFTESIAKNPIIGTNQWGDAVAFSGLMIAIISPMLGAITDKMGRRKPWIAVFAAITILSSSLLWFAKPTQASLTWALTWVIIGTISFEVGTVFYNAMMRSLAKEAYWGRISGWAWSCGYACGLFCLLTALFFLNAKFAWLNTSSAEHIRIAGPLVALWFFIFSLPFFLFTTDQKNTGISAKQALKKGLVTLFN